MMITGRLSSLGLLTPGLWKPVERVQKHSDLRRESEERREKWVLAERGILLGLQAALGQVPRGDGPCQAKAKLL